MNTGQGSLSVNIDGHCMEIRNNRVMVRLYRRDGGYVQEFYAVDKRGSWHIVLSSLHKGLLVSSEHREPASPMLSGDRNRLFGMTRESLRMVFSHAEITANTPEYAAVELTGNIQNHNIRCTISLYQDSNSVRIEINDTIDSAHQDPLVEYFMSSFAFIPAHTTYCAECDLDYVWSPLQRPAPDNIIGDAAFYSPAIVINQRSITAAMLPDLDLLRQCRPLPTAFDIDLANGLLNAPLVSYGFCAYAPSHLGPYHRHDMTMARRVPSRRLRYAFDLLLDADSSRNPAHHPHTKVARYLWNRYGTAQSPSGYIQTHRQIRNPSACVRESVKPNDTYWLLLGKHNPDIVAQARAAVDNLFTCRPNNDVNTVRIASLSARLAVITGLAKYRVPAERLSQQVFTRMIQTREYQDDSLQIEQKKLSYNCGDPRSGLSAQSGWAMLWSARMCLDMHAIAGENKWLNACKSALDHLSLLQCVNSNVWNSHFTTGLCAGGNTCPEPDIDLTAGFAACALECAVRCGDKEYAERASLALSAMQASLNSSDDPAARASLDIIHSLYGSVLINVARKWGVSLSGTDIVDLKLFGSRIRLELSPNGDPSGRYRVVFAGLKSKTYTLSTNSCNTTHTTEELQSGIYITASAGTVFETTSECSRRPETL